MPCLDILIALSLTPGAKLGTKIGTKFSILINISYNILHYINIWNKILYCNYFNKCIWFWYGLILFNFREELLEIFS